MRNLFVRYVIIKVKTLSPSRPYSCTTLSAVHVIDHQIFTHKPLSINQVYPVIGNDVVLKCTENLIIIPYKPERILYVRTLIHTLLYTHYTYIRYTGWFTYVECKTIEHYVEEISLRKKYHRNIRVYEIKFWLIY